jgi:hypothetical protein
MDLGSQSPKTYDACPYCLTEIIVEEQPVIAMLKSTPEVRGEETSKTSLRFAEEKRSPPGKASNCQYQLGYLSKRATKEKIPEECIMCEQIVKCMLKNVTG